MSVRTIDDTMEAHGSVVLSTMFGSSTVVAEAIQRSGVDGVLLDMQHGHIGVQELPGLCQVVSILGGVPVVRVPSADPAIIMKALDAGAYGIICPLVETADQARALVSSSLYPPLGGRSFGPMRSRMYGQTDDFTSAGNAVVKTFAMIETRKGLQNQDEILSVPGLGGVFIGPADLGGNIRGVFRLDPDAQEMVDIFRQVVDSARRYGILAGIFVGSTEYAKRMLELGFDVVAVGSDIGWVAAGATSVATALRTGESVPATRS
jgi:4-hydroxy-2-oxoheptanedioate aldolase